MRRKLVVGLLLTVLLSLSTIFGGESPLAPGEINKATAKWENKEAIFENLEAGDSWPAIPIGYLAQNCSSSGGRQWSRLPGRSVTRRTAFAWLAGYQVLDRRDRRADSRDSQGHVVTAETKRARSSMPRRPKMAACSTYVFCETNWNSLGQRHAHLKTLGTDGPAIKLHLLPLPLPARPTNPDLTWPLQAFGP